VIKRRPEVRDDLTLIDGYHSPQLDVEVRLNTNESPMPPPRSWHDEVLAEIARVDWHRYPDLEARGLRESIGAYHGVPGDQVFAANGSNEVLQCILLAYGGAGRTAVTFEPTYALHSHIAHVTGTKVVSGERSSDFTIDPVEAEKVIGLTMPAIAFLCSPNNPTGTVDSPELVSRVIDLTGEGLVVVDEAYGQFAPWSALELVDDATHLAVVRTFSKTWSMAAVRLGYVIGPTWFVRDLELVALPYHLDAFKQTAGRVALKYHDAMEARVAQVVGERERLAAALSQLPVTLWPSGANFILFRTDGADADEVWQGLVDRSVLVRNCSSWPRLDGCLRVTVGTREENRRFLAALRDVLAVEADLEDDESDG
jgi:histidinol-phosphate aminotransferase